MTESSEVKSHIKLKFKNRRGFPCVVVRLLQLSRKRTKLEFKALDSTLKTVTESGEEASTSMKCSELDKQIPDLIGVSAAVLESVIFCHQEESDWPMQDGAMVKKKFDDIFDSTRYSKALEAIMKAKKEKVAAAKDLKIEVAELGAHLLSANQLRRDRDNCVENQTNCSDQLSDVDNKLERLNERLKPCQAFLQKYQKTIDSIRDIQIRITETEKRYKEKSESLDSLLAVSDHELHHMLQNFDIEMQGKELEQQELLKLTDLANNEIKVLRTRLEDLGREEGKALAAKNQLQDTKVAAMAFMTNATATYKTVPPKNIPWSAVLARDFLHSLQLRSEAISREADEAILPVRRLIEETDARLTEERGQQRARELEVESLHKELKRLSEEREAKRREQIALGFSKAEFQLVSDGLNEAKDRIATFENTMSSRLQELKKLGQEKTEELKALDVELTAQDQILQSLSSYRSEKAIIDADERRLHEDHDSIREDVRMLTQSYDHRESLAEFYPLLDRILRPDTAAAAALASSFTTAEVTSILRALEGKANAVNAEYEAMNTESTVLQKEVSKLESMIAMERQALSAQSTRLNILKPKESEFIRIIDRLNVLQSLHQRSLFSSINADDGLMAANLHTTVNDVLERLKIMKSDASDYVLLLNAEKILKAKFQKKRNDLGSNRCPCCHQSMSAEVIKTYEASIEELLVPSSGLPSNGIGGTASVTESVSNYPPKLMSEADVKVIEEECQGLYSSLLDISSELNELQLISKDMQPHQNKLDESLVKLDQAQKSLARVSKLLAVHSTLKQSLARSISSIQSLHDKLDAYEKRKLDIDLRKQRLDQNAKLSASFSGGSYSSSSAVFDDQLKGKSMDEFEAFCRERRKYKEDQLQLKDKLRAEEDALSLKYQNSRNLIVEREKAYTTMKGKADRYNDLDIAMKELNDRYDAIDRSVREKTSSSSSSFSSSLSSALTSVNETIVQLENQLQNQKSELKTLENKKQQTLMTIQNDMRQIESSIDQISALDRQFSVEYEQYSLEALTAQRQHITASISHNEDLIRTQYQPKIQLLLNAMSSQERFKRNVNDNIQLRSTKQDLEAMRHSLQELEHELSSDTTAPGSGSYGDSTSRYRDTQREIQRIEQEKGKYQSEKDVLRGKLQTYQEQLIQVDEKLASQTYRNIEEKHRHKVIQFETTELVVKDLDSYYQALDTALQNFHIQKIKEINKIIRELWQLAYKGQDIDMIEVESGQETSTGLAVTARAGSRSYNYRVVMRKGDIPLDMRGRCSAGQRVLASIVIRLALAGW
jgi:DNA repair protein RAD50